MPPGVPTGGVSGQYFSKRKRQERGEGQDRLIEDIVRNASARAKQEKAAADVLKAEEAALKKIADDAEAKRDATAKADSERRQRNENARATQTETGAEIAIGTAASDAVLEGGQKKKRKRGASGTTNKSAV